MRHYFSFISMSFMCRDAQCRKKVGTAGNDGLDRSVPLQAERAKLPHDSRVRHRPTPVS
jgi:hypothetical protein